MCGCPFFYLYEIRNGLGLPLFSVSAGLSPSPEEKGFSSGVSEDSPKCCSGCLGRDSIANAATKVGPAVVNLSIHQGIVFEISSPFRLCIFILETFDVV